MADHASVTIGAKRTWDDWGLIWTRSHIGAPEVQVKQVEVPGRDGLLDLTQTVFGAEPKRKNRKIVLEFVRIDRDERARALLQRAMEQYCHGKRLRVTLGTDTAHSWYGRCAVEFDDIDGVHSAVTITVDAEPEAVVN